MADEIELVSTKTVIIQLIDDLTTGGNYFFKQGHVGLDRFSPKYYKSPFTNCILYLLKLSLSNIKISLMIRDI